MHNRLRKRGRVMAINWKNIKIGVSPITNSIYLGKTKKKGDMELWTEKSEDKTEEIIKCVMAHMLNIYDEEGESTYKCGRITLSISVEE